MPKLDVPATVVNRHLAELETRFRAGDVNALFRAIGFCGNQQIAMPEWVVAGFFVAMNRWWSLQSKTLDDAFGVAWPSGKNVDAARAQRTLEFAVLADVRLEIASGASVTAAMFARVGEKYGIKKTTTEKYYRGALAKLEATSSPAFDALLVPYMTAEAKKAHSTRKITKLRGIRSKRK